MNFYYIFIIIFIKNRKTVNKNFKNLEIKIQKQYRNILGVK